MKAQKLDSTVTVVTHSINGNMQESMEFKIFVTNSLTRHFTGDWGDLPKNTPQEEAEGYVSDADINNAALKNGSRVLSSYKFPEKLQGKKLDYYDAVVTLSLIHI